MSNEFWKMVDRFFLLLIDITGEASTEKNVHPGVSWDNPE